MGTGQWSTNPVGREKFLEKKKHVEAHFLSCTFSHVMCLANDTSGIVTSKLNSR